jgi:class 3 adenylate cyclase/tetratricopeptide (TPR) repeat protein
VTAEALCPACGSDNEPHDRFCRHCGSALMNPAASGDARKVVTVLFSDVAGSTAMAGELDPESLRHLMARYFEEMSTVLEHHRGTVEKFIGDAIVGVFGIPRVHEDDALRAVRAATQMRAALDRLNDEFERNWGVRILTRTGVNTGEVVTADPSRGASFLAADAVNVAARLEQAADPGDIIIGDATYRLVRNAVTADHIPGLVLKGKPEPLRAWKLIEVAPDAPGWARRLDSPLMDRRAELKLLKDVLERSVNGQTCELVTLMGSAGVGKSRLANEFLSMLDDRVRVVSGRCLPYGEGITFWPIVEVLRDAAGIGPSDSPDQALKKLHELVEHRSDSVLVADRLAALLGVSGSSTGIQETFWAVRQALEAVAASGPLVVVFDDIHWGEPTFLDLVEYLVDWVRGVPLVIACLARPELLEVRGTWLTGKPNAALLKLPALTQIEVEELIQNLLGGAQLVDEARAHLTDIAEGNPLFIEETLRMLVDDGLLKPADGRWIVAGDLSHLTIPPTIHAVLTARLDRLEDEERAVIERASVVGRVFWWGAVAELSPAEQRPLVGSHLQSLVRKELIRPGPSEPTEEDAFSFTHILIRDAAYSGIPKSTRAELHERFADWIENRRLGRAGEYEEILGYHLEQAYLSLTQLGRVNARGEALARRAAVPLASAGRRAFARGDMPAAVNLLSRAVSLYRGDDDARLELLPDLAFALLETGDFATLHEVVAETRDAAETSGDPRLLARALILEFWMRVSTDPEGWAKEGHREATHAISLFEQEGDERWLAKGWSLLGLVHVYTCKFAAADEAWEKAVAYAHVAGNEREELEYLSWVPFVVWGGPMPVEQGVFRCQEILQRAAGDRKAMSTTLFTLAKLEAMRGRFDDARRLIDRARATLEEVALPVWMAGPLTQMTGWVELLAGDASSAEQHLRWGIKTLTEIGEVSWLSTVAAILAEALDAQGRSGEAEEFIRMSSETAGSEDVYSQALLRSVHAKALARRGAIDAATQLGHESVSLAESTDFLFMQAFALLSLGEVLQLGGFSEGARNRLLDALRVCEQKGYVVGAEKAHRLLAGTSR